MGDFRGDGRGGSGFSVPRAGFQGGRGARGGYRGGRGGGGGGTSFGFDPNAPMPSMSNVENKVTQALAHGTEGRPIELLANYYSLTISEDRSVYHYDVDITREKSRETIPLIYFSDSESEPSLPSHSSSSASNSDTDESLDVKEEIDKAFHSNLKQKEDLFVARFTGQVIEKMLKDYDNFKRVPHAHDGVKNIYTTEKFNLNGHGGMQLGVTLNVDGRAADFKVKVKLVEQVPVKEVIAFYTRNKNDLSERVVSVFEIILRFIMGKHYTSFQRKLFDLGSITSSPQVRLAEFVSGFTSAVRMTEFGLALNVHLKTSCIISRQITRVSEAAFEVAGIRVGHLPSRQQVVNFNRFIRHLRVLTTHGSRHVHYTVDSMIEKTVYDIIFKCERSGTDKTIAQYFIDQYGITPARDTFAIRMTKKSVLLPMELVFLAPYQFLSNAKINTQIQRELLHKATNTPNVYFNKLGKVVEKVASSETPLQQNFGISLDTSPVSFMGRVLNAPRLLNSNRNDTFNRVGQMPARWGVVCFDEAVAQEELNGFVKMMVDRARSFGLLLASPHPVAIVPITDRSIVFNVFSNLRRKSGAEFIFVGLPTTCPAIAPPQMYGLVKYYCDKEFSIPSQCFKAEYVSRLPNGYFDQFLLKVNGKCGGVNSVIEPTQLRDFPFSLARTMFVGIDVNHPAETQKVASSVSAAVGSLDPNFSRYAASIYAQKKERDDVLRNLEQMIFELLKEFEKANDGALPENLVILRGGVSEGQYEKVKVYELPNIRAGVKKVTSEPVKITLIAVQKRHNTRFALATANTSGRKATWNVPSGTVVDNTIVEPLFKTFYLNSHFSPLGTSRSTKYVILEDELQMSTDTVQKMAFLLCHNSVRTRGVIALPTPVRYADLCCYRSKLHVEAQMNRVDATVTSGKVTEDEEREIISRLNELVKVNEKCQNTLYYC